MDEELELQFTNIINSVLEPKVVLEGEGWLIAKLMDGVFEIVFKETSLYTKMLASVVMQRSGFRFQDIKVTSGYTLPDGKESFTIVFAPGLQPGKVRKMRM